jgi:hypothetical protein
MARSECRTTGPHVGLCAPGRHAYIICWCIHLASQFWRPCLCVSLAVSECSSTVIQLCEKTRFVLIGCGAGVTVVSRICEVHPRMDAWQPVASAAQYSIACGWCNEKV